MTVRTLAAGMVALVALLLVAGTVGAIGPVELTIWLGLAAVWTAWWMRTRRRDTVS
jgi:hypothetical protein